MISVLTLTYRRPRLLEEAMESYLRQDFKGQSEMVIVNDSGSAGYEFEHPAVRIINVSERFPSIGHKLKFGFAQCRFDHIYRLDDDDLLAPWALRHTWEDVVENPGNEIYRSDGHYYFENNEYRGISGSVNNGNVYTRAYLSRIRIPETSFGEDSAMTVHFHARIYESHRPQKTMIYRWGMNTFHISGMGNIGNEAMREWTDRIAGTADKERGTGPDEGPLRLRPHFEEEYYRHILSH